MDLQVPDSQAEVPFVDIEDTLRHIQGELNLYTYDQRRTDIGRVQWPFRGVFVIHMTNLPQDCHELISSIYKMLDARDADGYTSFPVGSIEVRHDDSLIVIIGDEARAGEMRPMPS